MLYIFIVAALMITVAVFMVKSDTKNSTHIPVSVKAKFKTMPIPDVSVPNANGDLAAVQKSFRDHVPNKNDPPMVDYAATTAAIKNSNTAKTAKKA